MAIKTFDDIAKLSAGTKIGILGAVLIIGAVLFYFLVYQGQAQELETLEANYENLKKDLVSFKDKHANYIRDIEELNRRRARQKEQMRILPPTTEMSSFLNDINNLAELCGLKISRVVPKKEEGRGFYASIPVDLDVKGTFHQVAKFFFGIGQLERIINLQDISIGNAQWNESEVTISVNVQATTFRSLESKAM